MCGVPTPQINGHCNYECFGKKGYGNWNDYGNSIHCLRYGYLIASSRMSRDLHNIFLIAVGLI
jgi:hypothetical protein